jgi:hypothetical protein
MSIAFFIKSSNTSLFLTPVGRGDLWAAELLEGFRESINQQAHFG